VPHFQLFVIRKVRVKLSPIRSLRLEKPRQLEQLSITRAVVEPDDREQLILPAKAAPIGPWMLFLPVLDPKQMGKVTDIED
jgi:hypothetical protein